MGKREIAMYEVEFDAATNWYIAMSMDDAKTWHVKHLLEVGLKHNELESALESATFTKMNPLRSMKYTFEDGTAVLLRARDFLELAGYRCGFFASTER